jgi:hypothetical protein
MARARSTRTSVLGITIAWDVANAAVAIARQLLTLFESQVVETGTFVIFFVRKYANRQLKSPFASDNAVLGSTWARFHRKPT